MVERLTFDKVNGKSKQVPGAVRAGQMASGFVEKPPRLKAMTSMGVSGVSVLSGYVRTTEKNADWAGTRKWQTIADLSVNVSIVAASVQYFLNMVAHPEWSVKPAEDIGEGKSSKEAEKLAEFVEDVIHDMTTPWQRVVRRSAMYRFNGFGIQEWIAKKRDDGKIGFRDIEPRPAFTIERWAIDDDGTVLGVWQRSPQTFELLGLPRGKILYLVDDTYTDQPDGLGVYRMLAEPFNRLKQYLELEARAYERDMRGIPIGRAPITAIRQMVEEGKMTAQEGEQALQGITDFITTQVRDKNTSLLMDSLPYENQTADGLTIAGTQQWDVSLLSGGVSALGEMANAIDRLQREMARIIGTEHLMMGDQGGNRALAVDKSRNLYLIANAVLANVADGMDHDLIDVLWSLNGFDPKLKPYFSTEEVAFKDVASIAAALAQMATAGAVLAPDDPAIDDVRDLLGISHAPPPTPAQIGAMQGVPPAAPGAPGGPGLPPGAKKPAGAAPTPPAGTNGKQPGRNSPPETDDAKQQQVAGTTDDQEKKPGQKPKLTVVKADDDDDEFEKANPNHDERGRFTYGEGQSGTQMDLPFESRALTVRSPNATAVAAANDNVSQKDPAVGRKVKEWMAANARDKLASGIRGVKQVGADLAAGTARETVVIGVVEAVLHHLVPELPHALTLPVSAAVTQAMETVANKLGLTEHNVKAGFKRGITALINARKSALTMNRVQRASQYGVADVESGRVLTKGDLDVGVVLVFKADAISEDADDAVLHWLHGLYDLVNAYQPKRDKAELDAADAVVHVNRLHEVQDTEKFNPFHGVGGLFASGDGGGGTGDTALTGTAKWERPTDENIKQEYKVEYQNHFKPAYGDVFPNEQDFVDAVKAAPTVTVDKQLDNRIGNRSNSPTMASLHSLIRNYRSYPKYRNEKTLAALEERIKTGKPVDMPIVTKDGNSMRVLSGNTRMDIGFMHNDAVKVVMLDVGKYRKYNPNHDEKGLFASGDGGGGGSGGDEQPTGGYKVNSEGRLEGYTPQPAESASELYARTYDPSVTAEQVMATVGHGVAAKAASAEARIAEGKPTNELHQKDGKYTPEREALHDQMLSEKGKGDWKGFTPEAIANAMPGAGEQPTLYILGGRGGSGKSWFSKSPDSPFDVGKTMYINNDDFKETLPEYEGWNAALVHEEAGDIASMAHERARATGLNVTFDATLKSSRSANALVEKYIAAGYRVEGYYMHTAPQVSAVRAMGRFDHTGRYVPASYILESTTNEKSFDSMAHQFDKWAVYDNNSGSGPVKVASK